MDKELEEGGGVQIPTVGRIVHFYTDDSAKQFNGQGRGPYAAIVVQLPPAAPSPNLDLLVNLYVFACASGSHEEYSVPHKAFETLPADLQRHWEWPLLAVKPEPLPKIPDPQPGNPTSGQGVDLGAATMQGDEKKAEE